MVKLEEAGAVPVPAVGAAVENVFGLDQLGPPCPPTVAALSHICCTTVTPLSHHCRSSAAPLQKNLKGTQRNARTRP